MLLEQGLPCSPQLFQSDSLLPNSWRTPAPSFCPSKDIWSTSSAFVLGPHHPVSCQKLSVSNCSTNFPPTWNVSAPRSLGPLWDSDICDLYLIPELMILISQVLAQFQGQFPCPSISTSRCPANSSASCPALKTSAPFHQPQCLVKVGTWSLHLLFCVIE